MCAQQFAVKIGRPIKSVRFIGNAFQGSGVRGQDFMEPGSCRLNPDSPELQQQKASLTQAISALTTAAAKLRQFHNNAITRYKQDIARLSVEIARKVLSQKISSNDYKIEEIIKEAIQETPGEQSLEIHLNRDDLEQCKDMLMSEFNCFSTGIEFVANPNLGRAECLVKSSKGTVESLINVHLEKISEALTKAV
jgi:flagellar biosynthesis/type III secretory pathway protein FliH